MDSDSISSIDSDSIIGFKLPKNETAFDYRVEFGLKVKEMMELKELCCNVELDQDFNSLIFILYSILMIFVEEEETEKLNRQIANGFKKVRELYRKLDNDNDSTDSESSSTSSSSSLGSSLLLSYHDVINEVFETDFTSCNYGEVVELFTLLLGLSLQHVDELCSCMIDLTAIRRSEWNNVTLSTKEPKKIEKLVIGNLINFTVLPD